MSLKRVAEALLISIAHGTTNECSADLTGAGSVTIRRNPESCGHILVTNEVGVSRSTVTDIVSICRECGFTVFDANTANTLDNNIPHRIMTFKISGR